MIDIPTKPAPPPMRLIRESSVLELRDPSFCRICGSSLKRSWFGLGKVIGCIQSKCWNYYEWTFLPAGVNRSPYLYGAPKKPLPPPPPPRA
jgi:hypothetical protein